MTREHVVTILDVLDRKAVECGARPAYKFLVSGEINGEIESISYGELRHRARALAMHLRGMCEPKDRILLLYPPGIEYIIGLLGTMYAGAIAVPAYPPHRKRSSRRVLTIARDAKPVLALTTSCTLDSVLRAFDGTGVSAKPLATDELELREPFEQRVFATEDDIAFLQYTSGSGGNPKGVCVTHSGLMHNERMIENAFGSASHSRIVGWLPLYHDMGLVGTVLHALYLGIESLLMSPIHFVQRPSRWLEAISHFGAEISGGPDSAFALCAERVTAEEKSGLNLRTWKVAFNGSERVRPETLCRFAEAFAECGFREEAFHPCYGLAEATLIVSGGRPRQLSGVPRGWADAALGDALGRVQGSRNGEIASCGSVVSDTEVRIVDPNTRRTLREGVVGEIWVRGPGAGSGYWSDPVLSGSTFGAQLSDWPGPCFLRTGDLGFLDGGELFPAGRIKDLIVVDGVNYFPEDIERAAASGNVTGVLGAAAFAVDDGLRERVAIVVEIRRCPPDPVEVVQKIRRAIAMEYQLPIDAIVLVRAPSLARTSSGKIQRGETKKRYLSGELEILSEWRATRMLSQSIKAMDVAEVPRDGDVSAIAAWIAKLAAQAMDGVAVEIHEPLDRLGLDSLTLTSLAHQVEAALHRPVPVDLFLGGATALRVAHEIVSQPPFG
jgi:acyl-CoA synthetase (AMP-forming)/AMP-acid ligase II